MADQPETLGLVLVGLVTYLGITAGTFIAIFQRWPEASDLRFPHYLLVLPILWIGSVASSYCNFAVTAIADSQLRGEPTTVSKAVARANSRFGRLVIWTLLAGAVGLILQLIADRVKLAGPIAKWVIGITWNLAVTFVVPILVLEDVSVSDAIRKSAGIFKSRWGETVVADATVALPVMLAIVPLTVIAAIVGASVAPVVGVVLVLAIAVAAIILSSTLGAVVKVALYRYSTIGAVPNPFTKEDLDSYFRPKRNVWN